MAKLAWPLYLGNRPCSLVPLGSMEASGVTPKEGTGQSCHSGSNLASRSEAVYQSLTLLKTWIIQRLIRGFHSWLPGNGRGREVPHSKGNKGTKGGQNMACGERGIAWPSSIFFGRGYRKLQLSCPQPVSCPRQWSRNL